MFDILLRSVVAAFGVAVFTASPVMAAPPKGGISFGQKSGGGGGLSLNLPKINTQAPTPQRSIAGVVNQFANKSAVVGQIANKVPLAIPKLNAAVQNNPALNGGQAVNGTGPRKGERIKEVAAVIGQQLLSNLVSQIGTGAFAGGSGGGFDPGVGGGFDPGYSGPQAAYDPQVAPAAAESAPQASNSALQITDLDRGPAARAGLQKGDVILMVDGKRTRTFDDLIVALGASSGRSQVMIFNPDEGKVETREVAVVSGKIGVSVQEVPVDLDESRLAPAPVAPPAAPVPPAAPAEQTALQVTQIRDGEAAKAGVKVDDVIVGVDGKRISTGEEFVAAMKASTGTSELSVFVPSTGKLEVKTMKVVDGQIGLNLKVVPIDVK